MIALAAWFPERPACRRVVMPPVLASPVGSLLDHWHTTKVAAGYQPLSSAELVEVAFAMELAAQLRAAQERAALARRQALRAAHLAASERRRRAMPRPTSLRRMAIAGLLRLLAWLAAPIV